jgi:hypothetical protein
VPGRPGSAVLARVSAGSAGANHRWGCYKFPDANIKWHNAATGDYGSAYFEEALSDGDSWENATVVNLTPVFSAGPDTIRTHNGNWGPTN